MIYWCTGSQPTAWLTVTVISIFHHDEVCQEVLIQERKCFTVITYRC